VHLRADDAKRVGRPRRVSPVPVRRPAGLLGMPVHGVGRLSALERHKVFGVVPWASSSKARSASGAWRGRRGVASPRTGGRRLRGGLSRQRSPMIRGRLRICLNNPTHAPLEPQTGDIIVYRSAICDRAPARSEPSATASACRRRPTPPRFDRPRPCRPVIRWTSGSPTGPSGLTLAADLRARGGTAQAAGACHSGPLHSILRATCLLWFTIGPYPSSG
jgi:hypothetical protein